MKTLRRVRSRYRKTRRADAFCLAWVNAATEKLSTFAGLGPEEQREIEIFMQENHPNLTDMKFNRRPSGTDGDYYKGRLAGSGISLQHGVSMGSPAPLLQGGAQ
jgi:hypothetical protein